MAKQRFGLGRGLDALISGASDVVPAQQQAQIEQLVHAAEKSLQTVLLDDIIPNPRQPRRIFNDDDPKLLELSMSIKEHGLLQPIIITRLDLLPIEHQAPLPAQQAPSEDNWFSDGELSPGSSDGIKYQIIAGERRWRASRLAGLKEVPVIIKEVTPLEMLQLALIENIQRADLNAIEEALAYQALVADFKLTQEQVAKQVGKDRSTVANSLRLLNLAPKVRDALAHPEQYPSFTQGHARPLIGIKAHDEQVAAMSKIIALNMSVRQAEELADRLKATQDVEKVTEEVLANIPAATSTRRSADVDDLEAQFRNALTLKVDLKYNARGKGTLVLHFNNQEELERLYGQLVKHQEF